MYPTHKLSLCAGCVRIVNLQGEPTAALAPELTFDFTIETVGELSKPDVDMVVCSPEVGNWA